MLTLSKRSSRRIVAKRKAAAKALLVLPSFALAVSIAAAQPATAEFKWNELQSQGRVAAGVVLPPDQGTSGFRLQIENAKPSPTSVTVLTVDRPASQRARRYKFSGQVRYDAVEGNGYLELWNYFPDGAVLLADAGRPRPHDEAAWHLRVWRTFVLPFDATGAGAPTRLVVNVVLQGRGTVYLGPMEFREETGATAVRLDGFKGDRAIGVAGSIAGLVVGLGGALIGVLTSLGRARRFVIASATSLIALGTLSFVAGIVAFASSLP